MMAWPMSREELHCAAQALLGISVRCSFLHCPKLLRALTLNALVGLISHRQGTGRICRSPPGLKEDQ